MFFDREEELRYLDKVYNESGARLIIVYGRRRVGKTELLRHFSLTKAHIFFSADLSTEQDQLAQFSREIFRAAGEPFLKSERFSSWEALLENLITEVSKKIPLIIIDEFPYLCAGNKALPSILQKVWDSCSPGHRIMLILCGSYLSFMEEEVLGSRSPLYGRRTGQILLEPLKFKHYEEIFPSLTREERVYVYAAAGGTPLYFLMFAKALSFEEIIKDAILAKNSFLYAEPRFLLMEELREPSLYFSLLRAIASGKTRLSEIGQEVGIQEPQKVNRYLTTLRELGLVARVTPATEEKPHLSRKSIYVMKDPFFRFWFRYVFPHLSSLEEGDSAYVWDEIIKPDIDNFTSPVFEEICRERLRVLNRENRLPFKARIIGRWWNRTSEIDCLATDGKGSYLLCECKWTARKVDIGIVEALKKKALNFTNARKLYYGVFSRSGPTDSLRKSAEKSDDIFLFEY